MTERIVSPNASDELARIWLEPLKLPLDTARDGAVDGVQCRTPAVRQALPQLLHDIGATRNIGAVVEDRVAEKNDMLHGELL
ncbi:hypothetical protein [Aurantimonas aggregata]|uniref:hypothetical protein n=1 Tax=Aurantimonas aggregata TaxID=2047720 RepID=UPI0019404A92|nr:hypothetical protein [Aurantimonas aggregata]